MHAQNPCPSLHIHIYYTFCLVLHRPLSLKQVAFPPLNPRSIYTQQHHNTAIIHNAIHPPYHNVSSAFFLSFFTSLFTLCTPGTLKYKLGDWPGATWWLRYPLCAGSR